MRPVATVSSSLPAGLPPRGLNRAQAAEYLGIGTTKLDELVNRKLIKKPKRIDGRVVFDRLQLDRDFEKLGEADEPGQVSNNVWDRIV
jgi:hypothetical protein